MELKDVLSVVAVLLSPVIAIQVEKYIERKRHEKNRRVEIFKILMATRGAILSFDHVAALNRIDLEFSNDTKYSKVTVAWKEYFDLLNVKATTNEDFAVWAARTEELLANLLYEMGISLGYNFDKVLIKRNIYSPVGHANTEKENKEIRDNLSKVLKGEAPLLFSQDINEQAAQKNEQFVSQQIELQREMIQYYQSKNTNINN